MSGTHLLDLLGNKWRDEDGPQELWSVWEALAQQPVGFAVSEVPAKSIVHIYVEEA